VVGQKGDKRVGKGSLAEKCSLIRVPLCDKKLAGVVSAESLLSGALDTDQTRRKWSQIVLQGNSCRLGSGKRLRAGRRGMKIHRSTEKKQQ